MALGLKRPLRTNNNSKSMRSSSSIDCDASSRSTATTGSTELTSSTASLSYSTTTATTAITRAQHENEGPFVHFSKSKQHHHQQQHGDDNLTVQVILIPCRQEINAEQVFYNRREIKQMKNQAQEQAKSIRDTTMESIHQAYDASSSKKSLQALTTLYTCQGRGLERQVSRHLMHQRQDAVQRVLQAQITVNNDSNSTNESNSQGDEQRMHLLRMRSLLASRKARHFAQCLGAADAADAVQEEEQQQQD